MNSTLMFSSKKQDWETPSLFFEELNKQYHLDSDIFTLVPVEADKEVSR